MIITIATVMINNVSITTQVGFMRLRDWGNNEDLAGDGWMRSANRDWLWRSNELMGFSVVTIL